MFKKPIIQLCVIAIIIGSVFLVNGFILAWSPPGDTPPDGNVDAPINTGADSQYKSGALGIGGVFRGYGEGIFTNGDGDDGILKIGTDAGANAQICLNGNCFTGADLMAAGEASNPLCLITSQSYNGNLVSLGYSNPSAVCAATFGSNWTSPKSAEMDKWMSSGFKGQLVVESGNRFWANSTGYGYCGGWTLGSHGSMGPVFTFSDPNYVCGRDYCDHNNRIICCNW